MTHLITRLGQLVGAAIILFVIGFAGVVIFSIIFRAIAALMGHPV
jgi:hypothetical protein